jgi:hypothetical protein
MVHFYSLLKMDFPVFLCGSREACSLLVSLLSALVHSICLILIILLAFFSSCLSFFIYILYLHLYISVSYDLFCVTFISTGWL